MKNCSFISRYKKFLLLALLPCFLYSKCRKDDLPEYYFRCKVNGQDYQPNSCANCRISDFIGDTTLILGANRNFETLGIGIKDNSGIRAGNYTLNQVIGRQGDYRNGTLTNDRYFTDAQRTGLLTIDAIDRSNRIISGTFYFRAYNAYRNDSISITDGKFRLQYP